MTEPRPEPDAHFLPALIGDGRPLLALTGLALIASGAFALFLSATGAFLPQDVAFLGMEPRELCGVRQCRIVHFMFHDRVSFGGVLIAIGTLYLWLVEFPLKWGEEWAWWALAVSGATGFASFLCYLGYGYLDTWHGAATLALLPCFGLGMALTRAVRLPAPAARVGLRRALWTPAPVAGGWRSRAGFGRACLLGVGAGQVGAGLVIMTVGMTSVFVPEDLRFLGLRAADLFALNPRLVPLIAHDRAGFGGGLVSCGLTIFLLVWKSPMTTALWQALLLAGTSGFACAIGVHYPIGYLEWTHLAPAWAGAALFAAGMTAAAPRPAAEFSKPLPASEIGEPGPGRPG